MAAKQAAAGYVDGLVQNEERVPNTSSVPSTVGVTAIQDSNSPRNHVTDDVLMKAQKDQAALPGHYDIAAVLATTVQPMPGPSPTNPTRPGAVSMRGRAALREEEETAPDNISTEEEAAPDAWRRETQDEEPAPMETIETTGTTPNVNQQSPSEVQMEQEIRERLVRETAMETSMGTVVATASLVVESNNRELDEAQLEQEIRERIIRESVEANVVITEEDNIERKGQCGPLTRLGLTRICAVVIIMIAVLIAVVITNQNKNDGSEDIMDLTTARYEPPDPTTAEDPYWNFSTIERVRERGYVKCGTFDNLQGFGHRAVIGDGDGINIDQCRAISVAVFGTPNNFETVNVTTSTWFQLLSNTSVDVLAGPVTQTMGRDVYDFSSQAGYTFSTPFFYSGLSFAGVPEFVDCAEALDGFHGICRDLVICSGAGTTHEVLLQALLPGVEIVDGNFNSLITVFQHMTDGTCNVYASEPIFILEEEFIRNGYGGPFKRGDRFFSKDPLALVTRQDDPEWSGLIDFIINIFFTAEAQNITKTNARELGYLMLEGEDLEMASIAVAIVSEFGNYGDLYEKHLESLLPRQGLNSLSLDGAMGLIYPFPFGMMTTKGPDPIANGTLEAILQRGSLRCGLIPQTGLAEHNESDGIWAGLAVEFCHALSAAIFSVDDAVTELVDVTSKDINEEATLSSNANEYSLLAVGDVDVVAGARVTLLARYKEPLTDQGYYFSPPFYYDNRSIDKTTSTVLTNDAYALATRNSDCQFSDYVHWVVRSLFYAEEEHIQRISSRDMPVNALFGESMKQMLRDAVLAVGSYGELYNRTRLLLSQNSGSLPPRSGGNLLNTWMSSPLHYPIPFH